MKFARLVLPALLLVLGPVSAQDNTADGAILFARYCASCHGRLGEGDGPVAGSMVITVPNLRVLSARADGEFPRDAVMRYIDGRDLPAAHGERVMPVWGEDLSEPSATDGSDKDPASERIAAITDFIEQLQN